MLKLGNTIRLFEADKRALMSLTGTSPENINTVDALNNFIDFHTGLYSGNTPEEKLLKHLLESTKIKP